VWKRGDLVAILGASYKPGSPVTEESQGVLLYRWLKARNVKTIIMDPIAPGCPVDVGVLRRCPVVIVMNDDPAFRNLSPNDFYGRVTILDPWRIYRTRPEFYLNPDIRYVPMGIGREIS
jgi:UDP-N-acetyl-D-mannosaminuronate dehydrogenase